MVQGLIAMYPKSLMMMIKKDWFCRNKTKRKIVNIALLVMKLFFIDFVDAETRKIERLK